MEIDLTGTINRLFFFVLVLSTTASGRSSGPPVQDYFSLVCEKMTPSPAAHGAPQKGDGGYRISIEPPMENSAEGFIYTPGQTYSLTLVGTVDTFKGFLVQARDLSTPPPSVPILLGHFIPESEGEQTLDCDPMGVALEATIGHSNAAVRSSAKFTWIAPAAEGEVDFFYTVMRVKSTHFDRLSSWKLGPPSRLDLPNIEVANPPGNAVPPMKSPEEYRLKFRAPDGCNRTNCTVYVAVDTNRGNDSYIDIYMEGHAAGWVGIGFSQTSNMFSADVVACNRLNDKIECLDLWNNADQPRGCPTDVIQDVYLFEGSYTNGRLSCKVIKRILPSDGFDIDLDQDLYALYGHRSRNSSALLTIGPHDFDPLPEISSKKMNAVRDGGSPGGGDFEIIRQRLIKAHGILMIIAWPMLAVTAIFFPLFMRPALPKGQWFQVHRACMLASVLIAAAGFILIFVAQLNQSPPGLIPLGPSQPLRTTHFIIGVAVMAFHMINPIIAQFRCKPDGKSRWMFNLLHGSLIGFTTELFALINIGVGLSLFDSTHTILWVYLSWDVVYIVIALVLFALFAYLAYTSTDKERKFLAPSPIQVLINTPKPNSEASTKWSTSSGVKFVDKSDTEKKSLLETNKKQLPSKDASLRWSGLIVLLALSVPLSISVIVLICTGTYTSTL